MSKEFLLKSWEALNTGLKDLKEDEVRELLAIEKAGRARHSFLIRIYGRLNTLRTERERKQLTSE
jgi:hypothetical protein